MIMKYALKAGILRKPIDLVDRRFIPADIQPALIDASREATTPTFTWSAERTMIAP